VEKKRVKRRLRARVKIKGAIAWEGSETREYFVCYLGEGKGGETPGRGFERTTARLTVQKRPSDGN